MSTIEPKIHATGLAVYGDQSGQSIRRLYLHGLGNSSSFWLRYISAHDPVATVAADLPGFGESVKVGSVEDSISLLRDLILDVQPRQVVAHSLGGLLAIGALANDESERSLVLVGAHLWRAFDLLSRPSQLFSEPALSIALASQFIGGMLPFPSLQARALMASNLLRQLSLWPFVRDPRNVDPQILAAAIAGNGGRRGIIAAAQGVRTHSLTAEAESLRVPVWLIRGEHDRLLNESDDASARANIQRLERIEVLPDVGHWPMIEKPGALAAALEHATPR